MYIPVTRILAEWQFQDSVYECANKQGPDHKIVSSNHRTVLKPTWLYGVHIDPWHK